MAKPECPKCENTSFKINDINIDGAVFKKIAVQCKSCNAIIGILPVFDAGELVRELAKKLGHPLR